MTHDEKGYIQFECDWEPAAAPVVPEPLLEWRDKLHRLGLIGVYPDGIGFGNVSVRTPTQGVALGYIVPALRAEERTEPLDFRYEDRNLVLQAEGLKQHSPGQRPGLAPFLISGTATGRLPTLSAEHFAEVTSFDFAKNRLRCHGPVKASSESLSHAAVYVSDLSARAVIHIHHLGLWERYRDRLPTTEDSAEAGTPEMAWAIEKLLRDDAVRRQGLFVMGGHREGLMAFGTTMEEAGERIMRIYQPAA
jgi:hypothetical protein